MSITLTRFLLKKKPSYQSN